MLLEVPDRDATEAMLASSARENRVVASVVGPVLRFGSKGVGERHAIDVLGEDLLFETWSRYQSNWRTEDRSHQKSDVTVDEWASDLMQGLLTWDPHKVWELLLHYLDHEDDPVLRMQAGIDWLESINFSHASEFIDRIEAEAVRNPRLREVMRRMYPPAEDLAIRERFCTAMVEPPGGGASARSA